MQSRREGIRVRKLVRHVGSGMLLAIGLTSCAWFQPQPYEETYQVTRLTVVLMDEASLQAKWKELSGRPSVKFIPQGAEGAVAVQTVKGFFDYDTKTIYCPKLNFEVCGHELFHAILGEFHPE
ncbi:MAG: hypothetical protein EPO61_10155 [Nitrospirae bacterium]|nr:MAG: hypothetical protein EPO61_10155 [Nitrospirota bacterium]